MGIESQLELIVCPSCSSHRDCHKQRVQVALTRRLESFMAGASGAATPVEMGPGENTRHASKSAGRWHQAQYSNR